MTTDGQSIRLADLLVGLGHSYLATYHVIEDYHARRHHDRTDESVELKHLNGLTVPKQLFASPKQPEIGIMRQSLETEIFIGAGGEVYTTLRRDLDGKMTHLKLEIEFSMSPGSEPMQRLHDRLALQLDHGMTQALDTPPPEQLKDHDRDP